MVSALYTRITSPVLSSIDVEFGSAHTYDGYPNPLSDLFRGEQVVVFGRYKGEFEEPIQVSGRAAGERLTFKFRPKADDRRSGATPRGRDRGELEVVEAHPKRYFELMRIHDDLAEIAGLGEDVVVELGGAPVEIVPEGQ